MRYLLDTNIFIYMMQEPDVLHRDVRAILEDYDSQLCMSVESLKEMIMLYRNKGICSKVWKNEYEMVKCIIDGNITILPLQKEHMQTYAKMQINEQQGHSDPSDHVIIAQAITEKIPLMSSDTRFQFYASQGLQLVFNRK